MLPLGLLDLSHENNHRTGQREHTAQFFLFISAYLQGNAQLVLGLGRVLQHALNVLLCLLRLLLALDLALKYSRII